MIQRETIEDALENDRCGICGSVDHFREDCDACGCHVAKDPRSWHKRRGTEMCEDARARSKEYDARYQARRVPRKRRPGWTAGTPILVEEIEQL